MNYKIAQKNKKNYLDRLSKRIALTHHTMKIVSDKPQFLLKSFGHDQIPLKHDTTYSSVLESRNIYISGNYLKFSRGLSQTPWEIDGERLVGQCQPSTKPPCRKSSPKK